MKLYVYSITHNARLSLGLLLGLWVALLGASPAQAGTAITGACPVIISQPGEYNLKVDLGPCGGDGIWIQVSGVNLHLNGHTIQGSGSSLSAGIRVESPVFTVLSNVHVVGSATVTNF